MPRGGAGGEENNSKALCCLQKCSWAESWFLPLSSLSISWFQKQCNVANAHKEARHSWETTVYHVSTNTNPAVWKCFYCPQWENLESRSAFKSVGTRYLMRSSLVRRVSVTLSSSFCNCSWCRLELSMKSSWDCKVALSSIFSSCSTCTGGRRNDCWESKLVCYNVMRGW